MNKKLMIKLVEEKLDELMNEVDDLMSLQAELKTQEKELNALIAFSDKSVSQDYSFNLEDTLESVNEDVHSKYYYDIGRNRTYDEMFSNGYTMTDDGFWIKEKDSSLTGCVTFS
jgi:hypothetical protein